MSIGHAPTTATEQAPPPAGADGPSGRAAHPIRSMLAHRGVSGLFSVIAVAIIVYFATLVLPGDAAQAILGKGATPQRLALLRHQLHLDQPLVNGFLHWAGGALHGDFGTSLVNQQPVTSLVGPRLLNSLALVLLTAVISSVLGVVLGAISALRADKASDHVMSGVALVASALPEFVVGIFVVLVLAVEIDWFPAISILPPGETIWQRAERAGAAGADLGHRDHALRVPDVARVDDRGAAQRLRRSRAAQGGEPGAGCCSGTRCRTRWLPRSR